MKRLIFSEEAVNFQYIAKSHLKAKVTVKNTSSEIAFFKFKITRPRLYLVKPDKGFIKSGQQITINMTLHQDGVSEALSDKIKCFYIFVGKTPEEPTLDFEKQSSAVSVRMEVVIENLPQEMLRQLEMKSSEVKSLRNSKQNFSSASKSGIQATLEGSIREKEVKIANLRNEIEVLRNSSGSQRYAVKKEGGAMSWLIVGGVGLLFGLLSAIWI